ncbi:MAG: response regulator [Betaproteobacteria bacterium]|nr:MAG: response regulator [Betaproteobacteria bacterium]
MKTIRVLHFWKDLGLISRLMLAVGIAIVAGGGVQTALLVAEGAGEHSARLAREQTETLAFLAPLVADQALVGDYAAISQLLKNQVKKGEVDRFSWTDKDGKRLVAQDLPDKLEAPTWFARVAAIEHQDQSIEVTAGGVGYGTLSAGMTPVKAQNRLWLQFVKQLQIVAVTLFLMLQFIWLIFRGNLGTLRMLAEGANRFSQGDHAVRIDAEGAPEVGLAAEAFNNMANNIESLIASLGKSESKSKLLATIVEQSSEAIWTTDLDGSVTSWNSGAATMFGYPPAEAIGRPLTVSESTPQEEAARMRRLLAGEKFSYDARATTRAGTPIDIQVAVAPLLDESNQCVGRIAVARDVTQHKRSEEALRLAREAAETASHAKSSFLARMSHEIRTPMNGVLGMTELLLETGLTGTQRKYAETVQRSGKNLLGIINDLLDFSKIEAGKLELEKVEMDLRRTIEDIVELLAERAHRKGLELACSIPGDLMTQVRGDPLRLGQILTNLLGNAIKFTEQGSVVIRVASVAQTAKNVTMRFEVADTGVGISQTALSRIFEEFSQVDGSTTRKHEGSGLGLAISKQLVEMMGGNIHVNSEFGVGSTFWFTISLEKQPVQSQGDPHAKPLGLLTGVRALIVESSAVHRGILQGHMSNWEMSIRVAETPKQAIDLLAQAAARSVPFDIAVVDLGLPGMDALELARTIRARADIGKLRLVMLTRRHVDMRNAQDAGFNACLVKPVRQTMLYECLVNIMAGRPQEALAAPAVSKPATTAPTSVRGNILLVEDNLINQQVALGILQIQGYSVTVVSDGREALEAHAQGDFDLILMDCHMPEMDGYEATREIRRRERLSSGKRIPIVALTANAMARDREECLNAGMDDHLSKPFNMLVLQEMLARWLAPTESKQTEAAELAAQATAKAAEVLDRQMLDQLSKVVTNGKPELLSRVIKLYLVESPKLIQQLQQAGMEDNAPQIASCAHALKSCSANVGATLLSRYCTDIEASARRGDTDDARKILAKVEAEHACVQSALTTQVELLATSRA